MPHPTEMTLDDLLVDPMTAMLMRKDGVAPEDILALRDHARAFDHIAADAGFIPVARPAWDACIACQG